MKTSFDLQETIGGVFFLILIYLLLANSSAFNTIVSSGGNFVLSGISTLQGHSYTPTANSSLFGSIFGNSGSSSLTSASSGNTILV